MAVTVEVITRIPARPAIVFGLELDVDVHAASLEGSGETATTSSGRRVLGLGDEVTFRARHFGVRWRMTSRIVAYEPPHRFVDEQVRGPFRTLRHEHLFVPDSAGPDSAEAGFAGPDSAGPDSTGAAFAGPGFAGADFPGSGSAGLESVRPGSAVPASGGPGGGGTVMIDRLTVSAPFGVAGAVVARFVLAPYLRRLLQQRADHVKRLALATR